MLYIVATPIGNLEDISERARRILAEVDLIAAEDTRHSRRLLQHLEIRTPLRSCHDFNEDRAAAQIIGDLKKGRNIALITDAGTPLISDPGFRLVRLAHENRVRVVPIPGSSSLVAALSAAGVPTDRFVFEGYAPERAAPRRRRLEALTDESRTMVFFEAPHRILDFLGDALRVFGSERRAAIARELTKQFETIRYGSLSELAAAARADPDQERGEIVVLIEGAGKRSGDRSTEGLRVLEILLRKLPPGEAAGLAAEITGAKRNTLYRHALRMRGEAQE